jgi:hypothetical protein
LIDRHVVEAFTDFAAHLLVTISGALEFSGFSIVRHRGKARRDTAQANSTAQYR